MSANIGHNKARRTLAALRREIAEAEFRLLALRTKIRVASSDSGLAAAQDMQTQNQNLLTTNRLVTEIANATQAALDIAVKASQTDPLTGLRNRSVLWDRISHELDLAGRHGQHVVVLFLDLNDFKRLNDLHGHATGDLILQRVASVLTATVRTSDTVCRIGGDEFVVVASIVKREDGVQLAVKIEDALSAPFCLGALTLKISASVGFSLFPDDGNAAETLLQMADAAMYQAKHSRLVPPPR